jgi:hypothetical protein
MGRTSKAKKGRAVALQDNPSSEEEQDEQRHGGVNHLRTAENMLSAVSFIL